MSLPDNRLSTVPVLADMLPPKSLRADTDLLLDYSRGGVALNDPSQGLDVQNWTLSYSSNEVILTSELDPTPQVQFVQADIVILGLAFDQNMNPAITYELADGSVVLWWFNPEIGIQQQVFTYFSGAKNPAICLDDKRARADSWSDVIFAYQLRSTGDLVYRQQRDRYEIERTLSSEIPNYLALCRVSMTSNLRLSFDFRLSA